MMSTDEYLAKAAEFDRLTVDAYDPTLKKRYADLAESYRFLAKERQRLLAEGVIAAHPQPS
jgi:hypothetical protein